MATKKVFGVELVLVDLEVLHGAMEAEQLPINGNAVEDVKTYVKWTKVNVSKEKLAACDNCGGDSDFDLPRCPYCGVAGMEEDAAPPPAFEKLPEAPKEAKASEAKPKASEARKAKAPKEAPVQESLIAQVPGAIHGSAAAVGEIVDSDPFGVDAPVSPATFAAVIPMPTQSPVPDVPIPTQDADIAVGKAVPGLTIEEGIAHVGRAKSAAVTSYWDLGNAILNCYRGDLWKQMRDEKGLPQFRSFKSFCEGALQMQGQYAYKVMQVAATYTRTDVEQVDASKLGAMLRLPDGERQKLLEETKNKDLSLREVTSAVKERSKGLPAQAGAGKSGPRGAANNAGQEEPKAKAKKETHTLTVQRRTRVQLFQGKGFKSGADNKRAKRLADMPVGEFETLNGQKIRVVLSQDAGGLVLAVEVMK